MGLNLVTRITVAGSCSFETKLINPLLPELPFFIVFQDMAKDRLFSSTDSLSLRSEIFFMIPSYIEIEFFGKACPTVHAIQ